MQSVAERRAAESQTEAPDECRFACLRPGRAGVEWSAVGHGRKGSGAGRGRQAERSGRWSRRHRGGLCGHQFNATPVALALPKGNHRIGGPDNTANGSNQKAQIFAATCLQNWGDWSDAAPDASRAVCCANFLSEAISESVNGPHSAEKVAFSCCEAFAAESNCSCVSFEFLSISPF